MLEIQLTRKEPDLNISRIPECGWHINVTVIRFAQPTKVNKKQPSSKEKMRLGFENDWMFQAKKRVISCYIRASIG